MRPESLAAHEMGAVIGDGRKPGLPLNMPEQGLDDLVARKLTFGSTGKGGRDETAGEFGIVAVTENAPRDQHSLRSAHSPQQVIHPARAGVDV